MQRFDNIFTAEELYTLNWLMNSREGEDLEVRPQLGRINFYNVILPESLTDKITELVNSVSDVKLSTSNSPLCVEYNSKYGKPDLPPHLDGDSNDMIVDFQLTANTSWSLGVNKEVVPMEDNSAIIFNPNTNIHWRPHKEFQEGEFVRMMFFRFFDEDDRKDFTGVSKPMDHPIFDDIRAFRDSL